MTETIEQAKDVSELNDEVLNEQFSKERTESELERRDADEEDLKSHYLLSRTVVGAVEEKSKGYAKIYFIPTEDMVANKKGMIHTGFIFGSANYAAIAAVNIPTAVLAVAKTNFLAPMKIGEHAVFEAFSPHKDSRKQNVKVIGYLHGIKFFEAEFAIIVLEHHPLSLKLID